MSLYPSYLEFEFAKLKEIYLLQHRKFGSFPRFPQGGGRWKYIYPVGIDIYISPLPSVKISIRNGAAYRRLQPAPSSTL